MYIWHKETTPGTTGARCTIRDGSGLFVAECIASDAAAIVEAPAMLAALQNLLQWADADSLDNRRMAAVASASAAIAAATGATPTAQPAPPTPAALGRFVMQDYRTMANLLRALTDERALSSLSDDDREWIECKLHYLKAHDPEAIKGGETAEAVRRSYQGGGR